MLVTSGSYCFCHGEEEVSRGSPRSAVATGCEHGFELLSKSFEGMEFSLSNIHDAAGSSPQHLINLVGWHIPVIPALRGVAERRGSEVQGHPLLVSDPPFEVTGWFSGSQ